jgi:hypothetical protein
MMIPIDRTEIEVWGRKFDAKGSFPKLVAKLIMETTPKSTFFQVPSGSAVFIGGWDGIVKCDEETNYVPKGISLWEIGANGDKAKANSDYKKRSEDSLGFEKEEATYISMTTNFWEDKNDWIIEKLNDRIWKNIKVFDSRDISEWLENAPVSCRWFSVLNENHPYDSVFTAEEFWKMLSFGPKGQLTPKVVTAGREFESQQLLDFLSGPSALKAVRGFTKDEAIAFIIASVLQFEHHPKELFLSRSLIIDNLANFHGIRINKNSLNLIAKLEDTGTLYVAVERHHVLLPLGPDNSFNSKDIITLPRIDRDGQIDALINMGLSRDEALKLSKESGRDYTILKKLLGFPLNKAKWADQEKIKEIVPALLLGRWDSTKKGDRDTLGKLSAEDYDTYSDKLLKWLEVETPPLIKIGDTWRLTSPLDAWTNLSSFISTKDFNNLRSCFLTVLGEINPILNLNLDERPMASFKSNESIYSNWCREGITQSLILVALYGDTLKIQSNFAAQEWVDSIIKELLFNAPGKLWASRDHEMPIIAEASPKSFFEAIDHSLSLEEKPIMEMFVEEESWLSPTSRHTGLLWALEGLAWTPEYLYQSTMILTRLSALDPGGKLVNRPINSLIEIFKPWFCQTYALFEERMEILEEIVKKEFEIGWKLLIRMLPDVHGVSYPTNKMRWRLYDKSYDTKYTYKEILDIHKELLDTHSKVVSLLIDYFDYSESKLSELLNNSVRMSPKDRSSVLSFIESNLSKITQKDHSAWHSIRRILSHHRSYPDAKLSLPEKELKIYENLYKQLEPYDPIEKVLWMFNDHWPDFPEGIEKKEIPIGEREKLIAERRIKELQNIYAEYGFDKVKALVKSVKETWVYGDTLAHIVEKEEEILSLCDFLKEEGQSLQFIQRFIFRKSLIKGLDWIFNIYFKLKANRFDNHQLASIFVQLEQSREVWNFVEKTENDLQKEYWTNITPYFWGLPIEDRLFGIEKLIEANRFISALDICYHSPNEIPSGKLVEVLEKTAIQKSNEDRYLDSYHSESLIETLEERKDTNRSELIRIEWLYLPFLSSFGSRYKPYLLHDELAKNPDFFIEILRWVYKSDKEEAATEKISDEYKQNRIRNAYDLLRSWKQIPGMDKSGKIDKEYLWDWIKKARKLAKEDGRLNVADMHIGQVMAEYPEDVDPWPPEQICEVIDTIDTKSLKSGFSSSTFNKRGSSTRGVFNGGNIERSHASFFHSHAEKIKNKYPKTSEILNHLAIGYEEDAKRMDEFAERDKLDY